jgi:membrane peptidoglycan carboxypeptidase
MKKIWTWMKRIFFWVFMLHMIWFLVFLTQKFSVVGFAVENLKTKMLIVGMIVLVVGLTYFFWLRHIEFVKKAAIILRETFFIAYISSTLYLLLGIIFNPLITLTQAGSIFQGHGLSRDYVSYDDMGANIKLAVIASEDQQFPDHDGFDIKAIKQTPPQQSKGCQHPKPAGCKKYFFMAGRRFFKKGH